MEEIGVKKQTEWREENVWLLIEERGKVAREWDIIGVKRKSEMVESGTRGQLGGGVGAVGGGVLGW